MKTFEKMNKAEKFLEEHRAAYNHEMSEDCISILNARRYAKIFAGEPSKATRQGAINIVKPIIHKTLNLKKDEMTNFGVILIDALISSGFMRTDKSICDIELFTQQFNYKCPICKHKEVKVYSEYCPNCGSKINWTGGGK